jgi:hypothetical protein
MKSKFFGLVAGSFFCALLFLVTPAKATTSTYSTVQYEESYDGIYRIATQTLTKDKSPYLLYSGCGVGRVESGRTLTIEAGVVVKFEMARWCYGATTYGKLTVYGSLQVNGTAEDPVIFTSWRDDTAAGDTNQDSTSTTPNPGDWGNLSLSNTGSGNNVSIHHAIFRYGGGGQYAYGQISVNSGVNAPSLNNIEFASSSYYGLYSSAPITITQSSFHGNDKAIWANSVTVNAAYNWWGDDSGPTATSNPGGQGQSFTGTVLYDPWVGVKTYNVAVILAETSNVAHESGSITAQPCKLISAKTYSSGHSSEYYNDLFTCINSYYQENSYGKVNFDFTIYDNNGSWYKLSSPESYYAIKDYDHERAFAFDASATTSIDFSQYDILLAVHSGDQRERPNLWGDNSKIRTITLAPTSTNELVKPQRIILAETGAVGAWAHELGHAVGIISAPNHTALPDLYWMNNHLSKWDLMAFGNWDGGDVGFLYGDGSDPAYMSSYSRIFMDWLGEDVHPLSFSSSTWINSLETSQLGDNVFRFNLEDNTNTSTGKYYLVEARSEGLKTWDSSLPGTNHLVLYFVDEQGTEKYGYNTSTGQINSFTRIVTIPGYLSDSPLIVNPINNGTLDPALQESYLDFKYLIKFTALSDRQLNGKYEIQAQIRPATANDLALYGQALTGVVFSPSNYLRKSIANLLHISGWNQSSVGMPIRGSFGLSSSNLVSPYGIIIKLSIFLIIISISSILWWFLDRKVFTANKPEKIKKIYNSVSRYGYAAISVTLLIINFIILASYNLLVFDDVNRGIKPWPLSGYLSVNVNKSAIILATLIFTFTLFAGSTSLAVLVFKKVKEKITNQKQKQVVEIELWITVGVIIVLLTLVSYISSISRDNKMNNQGNNFYLSSDHEFSPATDLHLYCSDGRHIGVNYQTGEFENQISGSVVSGPMGGGPEWIYVPATTTGCNYVISAYREQQFLAQNPDIAAQISTTTDSYDIYGRYIDPEASDTGIYTSVTLANQSIQPGEQVTHEINGTSTISIDSGVVDTVAPTTTIILTGTSTAEHVFSSDVQVSFVATDNAGVEKTMYSLDSGTSWTTSTPSSTPFNVTEIGSHTIQYYSVDLSGNTEQTNSTTFEIVAAPCTSTSLSAAGGLEWQYCKNITITGSVAGTQTNYVVPVSVDTASLISSGKLQSNLADLRFANSEGTELPWWLESGANSNSTTVWVKVNSIPSSGTTIYMYYGNSNATLVGNYANKGQYTFEFFDDFEGSSLDSTRWSSGQWILGAPSQTGGNMEFYGSAMWGMSGNEVNTVPTFTGSHIAEFNMTTVLDLYDPWKSNMFVARVAESASLMRSSPWGRLVSGYWSNGTQNCPSIAGSYLGSVKVDPGAGTFDFKLGTTTCGTASFASTTNSYAFNFSDEVGNGSETVDFHDFRVRPVVSPEPIAGLVGDEEVLFVYNPPTSTEPAPCTTTTLSSGGGGEWSYCKHIVVAGSAVGTQTNYPIPVIIDTASFISGSKMQSDLSDLRFANSEGVELPWWLEKGADTSSTTIWVKTDSIASSSTLLYMYYGNSNATSEGNYANNGGSTFEFFDDFEGPSLDSSRWSGGQWILGSPSQASGTMEFYGSSMWSMSGNEVNTVPTFTGSNIAEFNMTTYLDLYDPWKSNMFVARLAANASSVRSSAWARVASGYWSNGVQDCASVPGSYLGSMNVDNENGIFTFKLGTTTCAAAEFVTTTNSYIFNLSDEVGNGTEIVDLSDFRVRPAVLPEPYVDSFGTEEELGTGGRAQMRSYQIPSLNAQGLNRVNRLETQTPRVLPVLEQLPNPVSSTESVIPMSNAGTVQNPKFTSVLEWLPNPASSTSHN